ncbi:hypothetical protein NQ318_002792 [Aromia moschata]|uniref:VLRF1 domain-containing protein n=1 Tax=Aromia moschata TaxID=1265417 RepID=A0AAV8XTZ7_9CUCU|nr:hypothetical protein NQ318_002792 [Aromia moschata]
METVNVFSEKFLQIYQESVNTVVLEGADKEEAVQPDEWVKIVDDDWRSTSDSPSCSYCRVQFSDPQLQREHYKLDWHRYNLKQSLLSKLPITEEEFNEKTEKDDLSSISGSDTEPESTLDTYATAQGKIFLQNDKGQVFSIYRCLLFDRKEEITEKLLRDRLSRCCRDSPQWTILMLGGGHFAGAVFRGNEAILHKTFHCYTVRAGQGGSQSSRDNKSGGSQPKSAGASLRRYNEQSLVQHVRGIVEAWRPEIERSSLIIYRASGGFNRTVLFGGSNPLLDRADVGLRVVPFSTRRATFTEVKRVHSLLATAQVYSSLENATQHLAKQKSPETEAKRTKLRSSCINRAKSRETVERPLPGVLSDTGSETDLAAIKDSIEDTTNLDLTLSDLDSGDSLTPEQRKKASKKKKPKKSKTKKLKEQEEARKKELVDVLCRGDLDKLKKLLENPVRSAEDSELSKEALDEDCNTLLHVAALNEHEEVVVFLLDNDADPCLKNKNQQTAYTCTQSKTIREALKQFAKDNPEKYNYNKAQIPVNALTPEELAERRKAQRKVKREKEKEKKKENNVKRKEEEEKNRFLELSDREKRALAAERRILSQSGTVTARCFLCGSDMAGKVPFEYLGNRFCTIDCLKAHRMQSPVVLSC